MRLSPRTTDFRCFLLCYIIQDFIIRYNAIYGTECTFFRARNRRNLLHYLLQFESLFVYSLIQSVHLISSKICQKVPKTGTFSVAIDVFGFFVLTTVNRRVVSSSLTWGAIKKAREDRAFSFFKLTDYCSFFRFSGLPHHLPHHIRSYSTTRSYSFYV